MWVSLQQEQSASFISTVLRFIQLYSPCFYFNDSVLSFHHAQSNFTPKRTTECSNMFRSQFCSTRGLGSSQLCFDVKNGENQAWLAVYFFCHQQITSKHYVTSNHIYNSFTQVSHYFVTKSRLISMYGMIDVATMQSMQKADSFGYTLFKFEDKFRVTKSKFLS